MTFTQTQILSTSQFEQEYAVYVNVVYIGHKYTVKSSACQANQATHPSTLFKSCPHKDVLSKTVSMLFIYILFTLEA